MIYILRYDKIPRFSLNFTTNDKRPPETSLEGRLNLDYTLKSGVLSSCDPNSFSPYVLTPRSIEFSHIFIYRLLVSRTLWSRVKTKISLLERCNGGATMKLVTALARWWRTKTTSFQGACTRFPNLVNAAVAILTDGQLFMEAVQAAAECDEEDGVDHDCIPRGVTPMDKWMTECGDDGTVYVAAEKDLSLKAILYTGEISIMQQRTSFFTWRMERIERMPSTETWELARKTYYTTENIGLWPATQREDVEDDITSGKR